MAAPTEDASCTDVTLRMNWVALSGIDAGSSSVIAYSLLWDAGDSNKALVDFVELTDALVTSFTVNAVTGGQAYRFMVRAATSTDTELHLLLLQSSPTISPARLASPQSR